MIDRRSLLTALQSLLVRVEADLLQRSESAEMPEVGEQLRAEYDRARGAQRTAQNYEDWRNDAITQAAAAWVLSCVFVRFLEDNQLIDPPKIAGPGRRLQQARDEWELYLSQAKQPNERDYLLTVFDELAGLPGAKDVFGKHNPIRELPNWLSGDGAREILAFFQKIDANSVESNKLIHDFTDPEWDTRFLGDLYQDLSEAARKRYALLQTPEFVEEFILERTLEPAVNEFGLDAPAIEQRYLQPATPAGFRMIDPACGSGHFLLGSFWRLFEHWRRREPGASTRVSAQRALDSICGVDLNPYAVAISRFRLLLAAMKASGIGRLAGAPRFEINVACGDSLLHGPDTAIQTTLGDIREEQHTYWYEDLTLLRRILRNGHYHAVVANPPYITPKDRGLNKRYRDKYGACHMKYSLSVPFMVRVFRLAVSATDRNSAGFTGQITANSFMKREFGKKLIEEFLPQVHLTHVIDTSGAYIPGHGTPTVILFGRNSGRGASTIRAVMGIRGEPSTPDDAAEGLVWSAIVRQIDEPGSQSEFVSVTDSPRESFHKHPWSIGGGGAAELKEQLDEGSTETLSSQSESIGFASFTGQDEAFVADRGSLRRSSVPIEYVKPFIVGDTVRDWGIAITHYAFAPYGSSFDPIELSPDARWAHWIWPMRTVIGSVVSFGGKTRLECGDEWWTWYRWISEKYRTPLGIVYAEVATHNHFVLDRGGKVFKQTAPVIKLPAGATEDEHLALLGLLNSSTACFWLKQACHNKGAGGGTRVEAGLSPLGEDMWESHFAFNASRLQQFPLPAHRPLRTSHRLDHLAQQLSTLQPSSLVKQQTPTAEWLSDMSAMYHAARRELILEQEELDWECYRLYGLLDQDLHASDTEALPNGIELGQRAFELVLARKMAAGELRTTWFERHGSTPATEIPAEWPDDYKRLVERRIELIETDRNIGLIEQPEYKRRWNTEPWESQLERALREFLLGRLESYFDFDGRMSVVSCQSSVAQERRSPPPLADVQFVNVSRLADVARQDADFMQVGEVYRDDRAFNVDRLVAELVEAESVPLLPILRYKPSGLRKRAEWEQTWELQREEDRRMSVVSGPLSVAEDDGPRTTDHGQLTIPVPPKYTSADFLKSDFWRLRGKLDVPKERWISFPHCEGPDGTLVIAWAGYDHLQLATAIGQYFQRVKDELGGHDDPRLVPLLACLLELLPWLKQWHNEPDAAFDGTRMGEYFEGFVNEEARQLGKTIPEIKAWQPPKKGAKGQRSKGAERQRSKGAERQRRKGAKGRSGAEEQRGNGAEGEMG